MTDEMSGLQKSRGGSILGKSGRGYPPFADNGASRWIVLSGRIG
jgi:hypothetical protein